MKLSMLNRSKGFTLTEILIVVVIIGILASLIIPRVINMPEKARATEAVNIMGSLRRAMLHYFDDALAYPPDITANSEWPTTVGVDFTAPQGWVFSSSGQVITATRSPGNTITLDCENGAWLGTGDYCDPVTCPGATGRFWPELQ